MVLSIFVRSKNYDRYLFIDIEFLEFVGIRIRIVLEKVNPIQ